MCPTGSCLLDQSADSNDAQEMLSSEGPPAGTTTTPPYQLHCWALAMSPYVDCIEETESLGTATGRHPERHSTSLAAHKSAHQPSLAAAAATAAAAAAAGTAAEVFFITEATKECHALVVYVAMPEDRRWI